MDAWTTVFSMTAALHVRVELGLDGVADLYMLLTPYSGRWSCCGMSPIDTVWVDFLRWLRCGGLGHTDRALGPASPPRFPQHERIGAVSWLARTVVDQAFFLHDVGDTVGARRPRKGPLSWPNGIASVGSTATQPPQHLVAAVADDRDELLIDSVAGGRGGS